MNIFVTIPGAIPVPLLFALLFFGFVALGETLRKGVFGMNPTEVDGILRAALLLCALAILRGDVVHLLRPARETLYGGARLRCITAGKFIIRQQSGVP